MKKYIYLILANVLCIFMFAQKTQQINNSDIVEVHYLTYMDKGVPLSRESKLLINNLLNESVYITDYHTDKIIDASSIKAAEKETSNLFRVKTFFQYKYIYTNIPRYHLTSVDWLASKTVKYEESIPKFKWILINETKSIENYTCFKAEVDFRGRKYTAWYTKDIPLAYGPWKFSSLPGLILEVYDSENEYTLLAKQIKFKSEKNIEKIPKTDFVMSLKEFISKHDELYDPNNWSTPGVSISQEKYVRDGIELIYEWEEQPKNK